MTGILFLITDFLFGAVAASIVAALHRRSSSAGSGTRYLWSVVTSTTTASRRARALRAREQRFELLDDVAAELHRGGARRRGRPWVTTATLAAGTQASPRRQPRDRIDLERRSDAEQQVSARARAPRRVRNRFLVSISPNSTTSGFSGCAAVAAGPRPSAAGRAPASSSL